MHACYTTTYTIGRIIIIIFFFTVAGSQNSGIQSVTMQNFIRNLNQRGQNQNFSARILLRTKKKKKTKQKIIYDSVQIPLYSKLRKMTEKIFTEQ